MTLVEAESGSASLLSGQIATSQSQSHKPYGRSWILLLLQKSWERMPIAVEALTETVFMRSWFRILVRTRSYCLHFKAVGHPRSLSVRMSAKQRWVLTAHVGPRRARLRRLLKPRAFAAQPVAFDEFLLLPQVGRGAFGEVHLAVRRRRRCGRDICRLSRALRCAQVRHQAVPA